MTEYTFENKADLVTRLLMNVAEIYFTNPLVFSLAAQDGGIVVHIYKKEYSEKKWLSSPMMRCGPNKVMTCRNYVSVKLTRDGKFSINFDPKRVTAMEKVVITNYLEEHGLVVNAPYHQYHE